MRLKIDEKRLYKISFACHRSGKTRVKIIDRKRAPREKQPCKINDYCSASISIQENKSDGIIVGVFCEVHCNHENEIKYLTLTENERHSFSEQLSKDLKAYHLDYILDTIGNDVGLNSRSLNRLNLITTKDLFNIKALYHISNSISQKDSNEGEAPSAEIEINNLLEVIEERSFEKQDG